MSVAIISGVGSCHTLWISFSDCAYPGHYNSMDGTIDHGFHRNHTGLLYTLSLQPARRMSMFGWTLILYLSLTGHYILRCIISSNKH